MSRFLAISFGVGLTLALSGCGGPVPCTEMVASLESWTKEPASVCLNDDDFCASCTEGGHDADIKEFTDVALETYRQQFEVCKCAPAPDPDPDETKCTQMVNSLTTWTKEPASVCLNDDDFCASCTEGGHDADIKEFTDVALDTYNQQYQVCKCATAPTPDPDPCTEMVESLAAWTKEPASVCLNDDDFCTSCTVGGHDADIKKFTDVALETYNQQFEVCKCAPAPTPDPVPCTDIVASLTDCTATTPTCLDNVKFCGSCSASTHTSDLLALNAVLTAATTSGDTAGILAATQQLGCYNKQFTTCVCTNMLSSVASPADEHTKTTFLTV